MTETPEITEGEWDAFLEPEVAEALRDDQPQEDDDGHDTRA